MDLDKELERDLKRRSFDFACDVTKEAAKGGYAKESLSSVLQSVYDTCLQLLNELEKTKE